MRDLFGKLLSLLRVRATAAGLEVSDQVVRLARFEGGVRKMDAIRLEPGIIENGKIEKREAFIAALAAFKIKLEGKKSKKKMNVVVCMSSVTAYTQVFSLPIVENADLPKAVELNLQMASPLESGQAYSGWQIVGRDEKNLRIEILSSFIDRKVVDEMVDAIFEAGFLAVAVESRALALTRLLREKGAGVDNAKPYVFVNIDNSGLDFLIVRNGALYFEYASSWKDLMDDKGDISLPKFQATLATSVRQVTNFYSQHWPEPLSSVILSAVALEAEAEKIITDNVSVPVMRLTLLMGRQITSEWLVALGSSLRVSRLKAQDREINLLGDDSRDRFHEEQFLHFMDFWRLIVPSALALLVLTFFVANIFLSNTETNIEARSDLNVGGTQTAQIANLVASSTVFNNSVALFAAAEQDIDPKSPVLNAVLVPATANSVTVNSLSFQSFGAPITLSGSAVSEDNIVAFQKALGSVPGVSAVDLPLTGVQVQGNTVAFSLTFAFAPPVSK